MRALFIVLLAVWHSISTTAAPNFHHSEFRLALVVVLAGDDKLPSYFEWGCRSIGTSSQLFDMLVFHEGNSALSKVNCADNVIFHDLGGNGVVKRITDTILGSLGVKEETLGLVSNMLKELIKHSPEYLVEFRPMYGSLFDQYLKRYSHWSYTSSNIVWGNLTEWMEAESLNKYDILTFANTWDASRLYIRNDFALHKNTPVVNEYWRNAEHFNGTPTLTLTLTLTLILTLTLTLTLTLILTLTLTLTLHLP